MKQPNPSTLPVNKVCCSSCPFKTNEHGIMKDVDLANKVIERTLFQGHQICHGTEGENREWKTRCKGAFDHNMEIYKRLGLENLVK